MSDQSRSKAHPRASAGAGRSAFGEGPGISIVRTVIAALVVAAGIAWIAVYINLAQDITQDGGQLTWMSDLARWNFLIGFGLLFVGLGLLANPGTPLGRGRGVVVGMLGSFGIGLLWILTYYMAGSPTEIPVIRNLDAYNLVVGIGFMAVGFVYATRWE